MKSVQKILPLRLARLVASVAIPGALLQGLIGCSGGSAAATSMINGTWRATAVACNGVDITSSYIPNSGSLTYAFDGTNLEQTRVSGSCTQVVSMRYSSDGSSFVVASGSTYTLACSPSPCTATGLIASAACGTTGTNSSSSTDAVTVSGTSLQVSESDSQATSICGSYGGTAPFTMTMTKQ